MSLHENQSEWLLDYTDFFVRLVDGRNRPKKQILDLRVLMILNLVLKLPIMITSLKALSEYTVNNSYIPTSSKCVLNGIKKLTGRDYSELFFISFDRKSDDQL